MAKMKLRKPSPRFGGGILADSTTITNSGKVNAQGIFTLFWAWDFPCERHCAAIITLFDLPQGKTKMPVSIKKKGFRAKRLTTIPVAYKKDIPPLTQSVALNFTLTSSGSYEFLFSIPRTSRTLSIPFEVRKKTWPQLTKAEIDFAKTNPNCIKSIRANINCSKCSHAYVFEETVLETPPAGGVHRFPASGRFKCVKCKHALRLRDVQGQMTSALKEQIEQAMKRRP
ncbi:MAG: hypothetical protein ACYSUC_06755 [Planctomycetota bacterium]|jgi:hypothetical protein